MADRRVFVDVSPLRVSRDFRYLYAGQMVSFVGSQLTVVAVPYQVYRLTHSSLQVGLVSLVSFLPLVAGSLIGGSIVDAYDRRRVLLITEVLLAATSATLALNASAARPALWPLYAVTAVASGLSGVDRPARSAMVPNLVGPDHLAAANALWQILLQVGVVAGPGLAGLLLAGTSLSAVYWIDVATFGAAFVTVLFMAPMPVPGRPRKVGLGSIIEGLTYLKGRQVIQGVFLIDINAMVFGMPRALFPALGTSVFKGGAQAVGFLYAAPGAGALLGALTTGWVGRVRHQGRAVIIAVVAWGAAIAAFGAVRLLPVALVLLAIAGWADVISAVFRNTMLQRCTPDELRGRLSSLQIAVVTGGPRLGDFEAGVVAAATDVGFSVVSGGLACIAGAGLVARLLPGFSQYRADHPLDSQPKKNDPANSHSGDRANNHSGDRSNDPNIDPNIDRPTPNLDDLTE